MELEIMKIANKIGWILLGILGILIVIVAGYLVYMQLHYYRIPDKQKLTIHNPQKTELSLDKKYVATTYNVGFGAYNHNFDFFMDKGELKNGKKLHGHRGTAESKDSVIQATDGVMVTSNFDNYDNVFANNFHSAFLAWPLYDPHGSVQSGLLSMSKYKMSSAIRRQYPVSKALIAKFTDLDRCFVVMHFPIKGGKNLVMINSHMSAYDKGGKMRQAQMKLISSVMEKEYQAGNYVIVGGDFNHALGKDMLTHFSHQEKVPSWVSVLDQKMLPKDFTMVKAQNRKKIATDRATDMKYDPKVNYMTVCDGFIVSKNISAKAENIDTDFRYSDHNPVRLTFELK